MGIIMRQAQLNKRNQKTSDAGFSLVELLIAVVILAIIVIPLLHMFVTSTRINVKARQTLRATTVAQDIMEGLKAYTLEEVSAQFQPPEGESGSGYYYPSDGFYIVNSSLIQGGVRDLTEDMAGHGEGDEIYYFGIENLKLQGGEYDALIKLDASTYGANSKQRQDDGTCYNPGGVHDNEFNGRFYTEIGSVSEVSGSSDEAAKDMDSSYHESKKLAESVMKYAKQDFETQITSAGGTLPADWDDLWDKMGIEDITTKREINVVIDAAGTKECKATIHFTYYCSYQYGSSDAGTKYTCSTSGYTGPETVLSENITRTFSSGNFYLFYYPLYSSKTLDYIKFELNNVDKLFDDENPLLKSITLAKQIRSSLETSGSEYVLAPPDLPAVGPKSLEEKENNYKAQVSIFPPTGAPAGCKLIYRTNIDTNLATGNDGLLDRAEKGDSIPVYVDQCYLSGGNVSDKVTNIIYDIEIKVYKAGAAQHFTEADFEDNDDVHKLATITNMNQ